MTANALLVALTLVALSATAIGYLVYRQSIYRRSVAEALTRGKIAREELTRLQAELQTVNQQLLATCGREEGLKATLALKDSEQAEKTALLEEAKRVLRLEFEKTAQALVSQGERTLSSRNQESLDQLLKPLSQKIDGFQQS